MTTKNTDELKLSRIDNLVEECLKVKTKKEKEGVSFFMSFKKQHLLEKVTEVKAAIANCENSLMVETYSNVIKAKFDELADNLKARLNCLDIFWNKNEEVYKDQEINITSDIFRYIDFKNSDKIMLSDSAIKDDAFLEIVKLLLSSKFYVKEDSIKISKEELEKIKDIASGFKIN